MQPLDAAVLQEAREWIERAERDLQAVRTQLVATPPLPEIAAYHAQQAAEKAFKAFLTVRSTPFRRTHDLTELQSQCQQLDAQFAELASDAATLTPYATQFRYPGGPIEPPLSEAQQALKLAESIVQFVRKRARL